MTFSKISVEFEEQRAFNTGVAQGIEQKPSKFPVISSNLIACAECSYLKQKGNRMFSTTHANLNEALKVVRKEQPRQFAVSEQKDESGQWVFIYSRPVEFFKEKK